VTTKRKRHRWNNQMWECGRGEIYYATCLDCGLTKISQCMEGTDYSIYDARKKPHHWRRAPPCPPFDKHIQTTQEAE
jgi:hypothetical protein